MRQADGSRRCRSCTGAGEVVRDHGGAYDLRRLADLLYAHYAHGAPDPRHNPALQETARAAA